MKNKLEECTVQRVYGCNNDECGAEILITQTLKDDFIKTCPFCEQESMGIKSAKTNITFFMDLNKPKTFGMQSQKNMEADEKAIGKIKTKKDKKTPWFRNGKINFDVLKNPAKFVREGTI